MSWRRFPRREERRGAAAGDCAYILEEIAENFERGIQAEEARRLAYLKFGNPRRVREESWRKTRLSS